ncbi:hypothetical protein P153DRAFT_364675 [Dothidotthia symphoricarpi CBS 119687]|uniref:Uncharacterized protein n=1 Tax=Dothidotthia symphoricarpi CBS 119687 TaxID=1392245 RepID=A0A6A6AM92_9PLEO|nr:uncharacterized protein P153DRAFT_364675 [Dothidotthia symphoricarpi CBS 119687]KAF2132248.1 hypothetical protein P153DRAFT_364675 [Dothidotthia symphoricarpi CBS 119687]
MLPDHSQQLLRAARSGRIYKPPAPPEDDNEMKDEEEESKDVQTGFTIKKYIKVARHLEAPEPEYLAKRRKGLPSQYVHGQVQPAMRETKVKKLDAEGNVSVFKVLVPEGQAVEGEVQPTDDAIEVVPIAAAPGTIVEGVGVVNAEGVVVASDIMQQTPPRRRPPPPKKKVKRAGPGRGKKKVVFIEGAAEQGTPTSHAGSDMLALPGVKQDVEMSDRDTPMGEGGAEEEEGSGEEMSDDDEMDHTPAPTTPPKPISAPASDPINEPVNEPVSEPVIHPVDTPDRTMSDVAAVPEVPTTDLVEKPQLPAESESHAPPTSLAVTEERVIEEDSSSSPDLPLSTISHSRQNSPSQIPASATSDYPVLSEAGQAPEPVSELDSTEVAPADNPSAPASDSGMDLLGSLERQLEKDSEDMAAS